MGSFVLLGAGLAGILLALLLAQLGLVRTADARLAAFSRGLLGHAVEVAQTSRKVMAAVNASRTPACSDADLDAMRHLAFESEYLRDVGRLRGNAILCTALWGRLTPPAPLPPPQRRQHDDDMLWANVNGVGKLRRPVDVAGRHSAVVFTSPVAFKAYETGTNGIDALVITRDGRHVYRRFGEVSRLGTPGFAPAPWFDLSSRRRTWRCSGAVDICVVAGLAPVSPLRLSPFALLLVGLLGAVSGSSVGLAVLLHRRSRASLAQRLRRALAEDRLEVAYQPLVRMRDRQMTGVEALARLSDDHGDPIPPEHFMSVAERTGQASAVTRAVVRKALGDLRQRLAAESGFHVGINITAADVLDPGFPGYLDREAAAAGIAPYQIVLEITERSTAEHDRLIEGMTALRARGYKLFIDDFGTGYSSLAYLAKLPISGVKVDRMFTQAIGRDAVSSAIVENICAIADRFKTRLVVEGIETEAQAAHILRLRPDAIGQGWLYGKPRPAEEL